MSLSPEVYNQFFGFMDIQWQAVLLAADGQVLYLRSAVSSPSDMSNTDDKHLLGGIVGCSHKCKVCTIQVQARGNLQVKQFG